MTLPVNVTLPLDADLIKSADKDSLYQYLRKLVYVLGTQMQQTNQTVNGNLTPYQDNTNAVPPQYPFIVGSNPAVTSTTTYTNSVLWARRANLFTQVWFDITWANCTDTGNLLIQSPYQSQPSLQMPYVGTIEPDNITFSAGYTYLTANIIPGTNTIQVDQCGSGQPVIPLAITASGHLRGSIMYVGQQFE